MVDKFPITEGLSRSLGRFQSEHLLNLVKKTIDHHAMDSLLNSRREHLARPAKTNLVDFAIWILVKSATE